MRFGCCVSDIERIAVLAEAGYDFCELPARLVLPFDDDATALPTLRAIETAPLRPEAFNVLVPAQVPLVGANANLSTLRAYLRRAFTRMAQLGAHVVVLGSGAARRIPDDWPHERALDQLAEALRLAGDEAQQAGLEVALEHLNQGECNVFNTLAECQMFITEHVLSHVRLLADLHHLELERESLTHVASAAPMLAHVHVADGGRRAPGNGGYDYAGFMRVLRAAKYERRISAECSWEDFNAQAPAALQFMRQSWEASQPRSDS